MATKSELEEKGKSAKQKKPNAPSVPPPMLMIDALKKRFPMSFTMERKQRWTEKLKEQDLEYINDLLAIEVSALIAHSSRYTTGLYGLLLKFKQKCSVVEVRIKSKVEGSLPVTHIEGYYIDCGNIVNGQRLFVNLFGGGYGNDPNQFVIYARKARKWAFHRARYIEQDYAWIQSDENIDDWKSMMQNGITWRYFRTKDNSHQGGFEPIDLTVRYWNLWS